MYLYELAWSWEIRRVKSDHVTIIEIYVFLAFTLLAALLILGQLRRYNRAIVKYLCLGLNAIIAMLISYILGLMHNLSVKNQLVPVWATFLVVVYSKYLDVANVNHPASNGLACLKIFLYICYVSVLIFRSGTSMLGVTLAYLLFDSQIRIINRIRSVFCVINSSQHFSSYNFLLGYPNNISGWKEGDINREQDTGLDDPLLTCKYVLNPNSKSKISIGKIWSCKDGSVLESKKEQSEQLKRTSLSFSLFWMLLLKFAGYHFYGTSYGDEALVFVRQALLRWRRTSYASPGFSSQHHSSQGYSSRFDSLRRDWAGVNWTGYAFRVVEVELQFLYDFFFGKGYQTYIRGFTLALLLVCAYSSVVSELRRQSIMHTLNGGVLATWIVILVTIVFEIFHFVFMCNSKWLQMLLLCTYVNRKSWEKDAILDRCIKKAAEVFCLKGPETPRQIKLGQYNLYDSGPSFLNSISRRWEFRSHLNFIGIPVDQVGRTQGDNIILSDEIKNAVLWPLLENYPLQLSNGRRALEVNCEVCNPDFNLVTKQKLVQYCSQLDSDTSDVILVWHIATCLCEINPKLCGDQRDSIDFRVATSLSKYCAYLVAFAPKLLPGHPAVTDRCCSMALVDAIKSRPFDRTYSKLVQDHPEPRLDMLLRGGILARILDVEITDPKITWRVLADVWAERMLFLAPNSSNEWAHLDSLAEGAPEFITYLWALTFHAGIINRESLNTSEMQGSAESASTI